MHGASRPTQRASGRKIPWAAAEVHVAFHRKGRCLRDSLPRCNTQQKGDKPRAPHKAQHASSNSSRRPSFSRLAASSAKHKRCNEILRKDSLHTLTLARSRHHRVYTCSLGRKVELLNLRSHGLKQVRPRSTQEPMRRKAETQNSPAAARQSQQGRKVLLQLLPRSWWPAGASEGPPDGARATGEAKQHCTQSRKPRLRHDDVHCCCRRRSQRLREKQPGAQSLARQSMAARHTKLAKGASTNYGSSAHRLLTHSAAQRPL